MFHCKIMKCCYSDAKETKGFSSLAPNNQVPFYICGYLLRDECFLWNEASFVPGVSIRWPSAFLCFLFVFF